MRGGQIKRRHRHRLRQRIKAVGGRRIGFSMHHAEAPKHHAEADDTQQAP